MSRRNSAIVMFGSMELSVSPQSGLSQEICSPRSIILHRPPVVDDERDVMSAVPGVWRFVAPYILRGYMDLASQFVEMHLSTLECGCPACVVHLTPQSYDLDLPDLSHGPG